MLALPFLTNGNFNFHTHKPHRKFNFHMFIHPPFHPPALEFKVLLLAMLLSI